MDECVFVLLPLETPTLMYSSAVSRMEKQLIDLELVLQEAIRDPKVWEKRSTIKAVRKGVPSELRGKVLCTSHVANHRYVAFL